MRSQFAHAIDLMPTIMGAAGLDVPDVVDGVAQQPVDGVSMLSALEDPAAPELHHTQYFEMMGSRSIYHEGWKATTDHISTGILDEEELAVGSRSFDEDRWELFDLTEDFSEATDRADDEPERVRAMSDLWDAEAERNNVLPISDGLVDRFGGFIPPTWPAGPSRTFRPGGGPVADESVPLLWGGFDITADIDLGPGGTDGVVYALGDWFGGYALYLVGGRARFTFARGVGALELAAPGALGAGRHEVLVSYAVGDGDGPGRMVLVVDGTAVDETPVEGMLPLALQHGGAGLRLGWDSGFPVSSRYTPPAHFGGTVHEVRVDTPGSLRHDPATRSGRRSTPTDRRRCQASPATAARACARCSRGMARRHRRQVDGGQAAPAGRPEGCAAIELRVAQRPERRLQAGTAVAQERRRLGRRHRARPYGMRGVGPVDVLRAVGDAVPRRHALQPAQAVAVSLGDVVEHHAHRPSLLRHRPRPDVLAARLREGHRLGVRGGKVVGQGGRPLTRHRAAPPAWSTPPRSTTPGRHPPRRPGRPGAAAARSPGSARRAGRPRARSRR